MGQHRREDINGDTKQNCSNRRDLHQNREKMTTRMDKTCDMIIYIIPTYLLDHLYLTTNKTINCGSKGTAAPNPDSVQTVMCRLREIRLYETHTVGDISWVLMSLPCISTALNAVGLGILIDLLQKKTLTLTLTNNVNPFNNVKPFNDHSTISFHFCFIPIQT